MAYRGISATRKAQQGPATDLSRWSLVTEEGRQTWHYLASGSAPRPNAFPSRYHTDPDAEALQKAEAAVAKSRSSMAEALTDGFAFLSKLQCSDGHLAGDYGGPMFLLPGYAIVYYVTGTPIPEENRLEMCRYLTNMQNDDGGWGIHIESQSTVFGTALNYVAMRIMGVARDDKRMERARQWLEPRGGCLGIPSWGKFWLAVLNVFQWEGVHSLFPEMVLLPEWFPLHTRRLWSYCRTVYMPMTYIYGKRFQGKVTPLVHELREELIFEPYSSVDWRRARSFIAPEDLYTPHTFLLRMFFNVVDTYEFVAPRWLRQRAMNWIYQVLRKEDEFTKYICIGPVNKMINMLCVWIEEGPTSEPFRKHLERVPDYIWMGRDGMKMNGTNGSQLWDTSFMVQALIESGPIKEQFKDIFRKAYDFVDLSQIRVDHPDHRRYYRDETKGGWPFSTRDIGWVVADCTGEGLKAALICSSNGYTETPMAEERLFDAVNILLLMQNSTGGYATCEKTRGWHFFEYFNASEVFGEIMIDYDYVECTSSALQALTLFHELYPTHRAAEVKRAVKRAIDFILSIQREDGSWEGLWGVCFTYGTWFGVEGLIDAGLDPSHPAIRKACDFLVSKQREDGGWGETFMSCVTREYVQHPDAQVVMTAWAVLTLAKAKYPDRSVVRRGVELLMSRQLPSGAWAHESTTGVFNKNALINYDNYVYCFPLWAIGRAAEYLGEQ